MSTDSANNFALPCVSLNLSNICYRPQRSCEGYVFTGVCLSTGEEYLTRHTPPPRPGTPWDQVHPPGQVHPPRTRYTPPDQVHPPRPGTPGPGTALPRTRYTPRPRYGHCCGRYASYWNAFLF